MKLPIGQILAGNALNIISKWPNKCIDVVLTDPPYGIEGGKGGQLQKRRKADYDGRWEDTPKYIKEVCVPIIEQCLRIAKTVVFTPGSRCLCSYPQPAEVGGFFSPASDRIGKFGFQTCHPIFYYGYYKNRGKGAIATGIVIKSIAEKTGHPCTKPLREWKWLLRRCSEPGNIILDPFCGSGTTLVAAEMLGLKWIGIDISERYCQIARERVARAKQNPGFKIIV